MRIGLAICWRVGCANLDGGVPAVSTQMIAVSGGDTGERLELGRRGGGGAVGSLSSGIGSGSVSKFRVGGHCE